VHGGPSGAGVDPRAELGGLGAVGAHEQVAEAGAGLARGAAPADADHPDQRPRPRRHRGAREGQVGHAADADHDAAGADLGQRAQLRVAAEGVEDHVEVAELGDGVGGVVDRLVGAEAAQEVEVAGAGGGEDVGAEVLGDLDRQRADAAGAGVDQHALAALQLGGLA